MRLLLQVKGVISITFDMNKKRCILRTKTEVRPEVSILILFLDPKIMSIYLAIVQWLACYYSLAT